MLAALRVQNLAVIDEVEVRFGPGFNVLTGETGAGKSILVDALQLVLGRRADSDVIRTGADESTVEAIFEGVELADRLLSVGLPAPGPELLVRRTVARGGRGRAWLNGSLVTVALLEQVTRGLVEVSSQHQHLALLDPDVQLDLLDAYGGLGSEVSAYREAFDALAAARRELEALKTDDAERARRADYLSFQIDEIERLDPKPAEDEALAREERRLASAEKLREAAAAAEAALYSGDGAAVEVVGRAAARVAEAAPLDPALEPLAASMKSALVELEEAARSLGRYARGVEADPARLAQIADRRDALRRLGRKHGGELAQVLSRRDAMRVELDGIARHGERLAELNRTVKERTERAGALAQALSERRSVAARSFGRAVRAELARLAMAKTEFEPRLRPAPDLTPRGADALELLISPNPGEEVRPLARVASGGELSRVMLAIRRALMKADPVPTSVFDEVDAGIGGAVAEVVGRMLKDVSAGRQVLCVTHLPQIAAFADRHYAVSKTTRGGRTASTVKALSPEERTFEIARMVAGVEVTSAARAHADSLLQAAKRRTPAASQAE